MLFRSYLLISLRKSIDIRYIGVKGGALAKPELSGTPYFEKEKGKGSPNRGARCAALRGVQIWPSSTILLLLKTRNGSEGGLQVTHKLFSHVYDSCEWPTRRFFI